MRPVVRALTAVLVDSAPRESVWTVRCYRVWGLYRTSPTIPSWGLLDALRAQLAGNRILTGRNAASVEMDITVQMGSAICVSLVL
jgi:hypothetical protein